MRQGPTLSTHQYSAGTHSQYGVNLESSINQPIVSAFELWEEDGAPGGNPHQYGKSMQTPHR